MGAPATDDRALRRNVGYNLLGWILPAATAIVSLPILARELGADAFGLLTVAWSTVALFTVLDFGIGRSLTRLIASHSARGDTRALPDLFWTSTWAMLAVTGLLAVLGVATAPLIVRHILHVGAESTGDAIAVVRLLAIALPALAHGVVLRGALEAVQQFGRVNWLRIPLGVATYGGPLLALPFGRRAAVAVGIIVSARLMYWLAHFPMLEVVRKGLSRPRAFSRSAMRELGREGGWITVSSVISPILVNADRLVIAAMLPIASSGWYGVAAEIATKQWLFTAALQPVLFAALAATVERDPSRGGRLMSRATRVTLLALFPAALGLVLFASPGLAWWIKSSVDTPAAAVLRWLAIAVFANAVAQVPYAALQADRHSKYAALLHVVELPIYLGLLFWLVRTHGLEGAAIAFCVRMSADSVAMWVVAARRIPAAHDAVRVALRLGLALVAVLVLAALAVARLA